MGAMLSPREPTDNACDLPEVRPRSARVSGVPNVFGGSDPGGCSCGFGRRHRGYPGHVADGEAGVKGRDRNRPTFPEVAPLVRALLKREGGAVGCCLHLVLDEPNYENGAVEYVLKEAQHAGHADCIEIAEKMLLMSRTQRKRLGACGE